MKFLIVKASLLHILVSSGLNTRLKSMLQHKSIYFILEFNSKMWPYYNAFIVAS